MTIWTAKMDILGRRQCTRCHKMFSPKKEGQVYGPKCARKVAQIPIEERLDTRPYEQEGSEKGAAKTPEESAVAAYRGAVLV